ncbi:MAG: SPOR domain-containing protein [Cyclobacteriaceae bacterium]
MRNCGIIILILLVGCKAAPPASTASYSEDLSVYRPKPVMTNTDSAKVETLKEAFTPLEGHIKAELDSIVRVSVAQNKEGKLVNGFIIQLYTGNSRDEANAVWNRFDELFPGLSPKVSYLQPNFRVKAGRFTNKLKAQRIFRDIKAEFPKALLVPERFIMNYE